MRTIQWGINVILFSFIFVIFACSSTQTISSSQIDQSQKAAVYLQFYDPETSRTHSSCGGTIISSKYILSAKHCNLGEGYKIRVFLYDEASFEAKIIASGNSEESTASSDWMILETEEPLPNNYKAEISNSLPNVGERIYSIGHPYGIEWMFHSGYWSKTKPLNYYNEIMPNMFINSYVVQLPTGLGSSGSGVFNNKRELVAIITSVVSYGRMDDFYRISGYGGITIVIDVPQEAKDLINLRN